MKQCRLRMGRLRAGKPARPAVLPSRCGCGGPRPPRCARPGRTPTRPASSAPPAAPALPSAMRALPADLAPDTATGDRVAVAGRVMLYRTGGKLCFATIRDGSGDLQVMISLDRVGADALEAWKRDVDLGDHIGVEGEVITSRRGELSVLADSFVITAKALRPLPEKHAGLSDPATRMRQRYLDLLVNPQTRQMAELRGVVTRAIREELHERGFLEVETPVLQVLHGGANARPFVTRINAYGDMTMYLRIALELY